MNELTLGRPRICLCASLLILNPTSLSSTQPSVQWVRIGLSSQTHWRSYLRKEIRSTAWICPQPGDRLFVAECWSRWERMDEIIRPPTQDPRHLQLLVRVKTNCAAYESDLKIILQKFKHVHFCVCLRESVCACFEYTWVRVYEGVIVCVPIPKWWGNWSLEL